MQQGTDYDEWDTWGTGCHMASTEGVRDMIWTGNMESSVELYQNQVVAFAGAVRTGNQI